METLRAGIAWLQLCAEYNLNRLGFTTRDEQGVVTTEMAVAIGALVAIGVAGGAIFMTKMTSNAYNIPDTVQAP
jgi:hypothetical protein